MQCVSVFDLTVAVWTRVGACAGAGPFARCVSQVSCLWTALIDQGVSPKERKLLHDLLSEAVAMGASGKVRPRRCLCRSAVPPPTLCDNVSLQ